MINIDKNIKKHIQYLELKIKKQEILLQKEKRKNKQLEQELEHLKRRTK